MIPVILLVGTAGSGKDTLAQALADRFQGVCVAQADPMKRFAAKVFGFTELQLWGPSAERNRPCPQFSYPGKMLECTCNFDDQARDWVEEVLPEPLHDKGERHLRTWFDIVTRYIESGKQLTPRYVLQTIGTEWGRTVNPNMWAEYATRIAEDLICPLKVPGCSYDRTIGLVSADGHPKSVIVTDGRFLNEVVNAKKAGGLVLQIQRPTAEEVTGGVAGHKSETEQKSIPYWFYDGVVVNNGGLEEFKAVGVDLVEKLLKPSLAVVGGY